MLQRAVHHYSRPWSYFLTAPELARKGRQGELLLNFTLIVTVTIILNNVLSGGGVCVCGGAEIGSTQLP